MDVFCVSLHAVWVFHGHLAPSKGKDRATAKVLKLLSVWETFGEDVRNRSRQPDSIVPKISKRFSSFAPLTILPLQFSLQFSLDLRPEFFEDVAGHVDADL